MTTSNDYYDIEFQVKIDIFLKGIWNNIKKQVQMVFELDYVLWPYYFTHHVGAEENNQRTWPMIIQSSNKLNIYGEKLITNSNNQREMNCFANIRYYLRAFKNLKITNY